MTVTNAPRTCLVWAIIIAICSGFIIFEGRDPYLRTDGPMITLESNATMRLRFGVDTISTKLSKGDSLRVLGIDGSSYGQRWLLQSTEGNVGWVDASDLNTIRQIVTDGPDKGDTVSVKAKWFDWYIKEYTYTNKDGEERSRSTDDFMPVIDDLDDYSYDLEAIAGVCTQQKFESKAMDKSIDEVNKAFGLPVLMLKTKDGWEAQYSWKTFEPATGQMWKPNVTFGNDSIAKAVSFGQPSSRAAGWLKKLPLAGQIINMPLTSWMVRTGRYARFDNPLISTGIKVLMICMVVLYLICLISWMFFTESLPVLVIGWLMEFPPLYWFLNDRWLRVLLFVVALVSCYVWAVMMMAWGMFPFWSIIILIVGWYAFSLASSPLCTMPHCRCPKCRRMYTIKFDHEDLEYSENVKDRDIKRGKRLGKRTESWKTWTQVNTTTTYGDGHQTHNSYKTNEKTHHRDYNTYEFTGYDVTYRVDHYRSYFKCQHCGHIDETTSESWNEIDRKKTDVYAAEIAGDDY